MTNTPTNHTYVPSAIHLGDCKVCGQLPEAAIHAIAPTNEERAREIAFDWYTNKEDEFPDLDLERSNLIEGLAKELTPALERVRREERRRCLDIVNAEIEWGADPIEIRDKIERGEQPRQIPGWNCPSEEED